MIKIMIRSYLLTFIYVSIGVVMSLDHSGNETVWISGDNTELADGNELLQGLLESTEPSWEQDILTQAVIGEPRLVRDAVGLPTAVVFPATPLSGIVLVPTTDINDRENLDCPWNLDACVTGQFTLQFQLLVKRNLTIQTNMHLLSFVTSRINKQSKMNENQKFILKFEFHKHSLLSISWSLLDQAFEVIKQNQIIQFDLDKWNLVEVTVDLRTDTFQIVSNKQTTESGSVTQKQQQQQQQFQKGNYSINLDKLLISPSEPQYKQYDETTLLRLEALIEFVGVLIGQALNIQPTSVNNSDFRLKDFHFSSPDLVRRRSPRRLIEMLDKIPTNTIKRVSSVDFPDGGYVRYDFRNRLRKNVDEERLTIDFILPTGVTSGLLWFAESEQSKSYVYIKDSRLYYTYAVIDHTGKAQLTLTEEIFLNKMLVHERSHVLELVRNRDNLTITLDHRSHASKSIEGRAPLVPTDSKVYLGGSYSPIKDTDGKVDNTFRGRITKAEVRRKGDSQVNLLDAIKDPKWRNSVQTVGNTEVRQIYPKAYLVIRPTSSTGHRRNGIFSSLEVEFSRNPIPITFMGTDDAIVRFDTWDFSVYRSFEIEFLTYEPNGILFFVGPNQEHTDFVCIELFDGNIYFVYAVGNHHRHIRLNPQHIKVNNGKSYRVFVSRNDQNRFLVKFNDQIVDIEEGTNAHQTEFASYTYIGSIDHVGRLPWHVWSRENFAGCILSIRVNEENYLDVSSRMSQHTDYNKGIQFGVCQVPKQRCDTKICGGGQCSERSYPFLEELNFACDCSGSDKTYPAKITDIRRSVGCFRDSPILHMDGEVVYLIDFEQQSNKMTTHTDDISLQFRTTTPNAPLFYSVSRGDRSYFRVDLVNGQIRVQTNINHPRDSSAYEEFLLSSPLLNDNMWHTLRIARRAEHLVISVDRASQIGRIPLLGPLRTFQLVAQQIYLGSAGPPNYGYYQDSLTKKTVLPPPPRFIGQFRNFYWNQYDFIGTKQMSTKYLTHLLTPPAPKHTFPQWPREQTYAVTLKSELIYVHLNEPIEFKNGGDIWLLEFKTNYDGILFSAREITAPNDIHITAILLNGRMHIVYSINGQQGVYQLISGPTADNVADGNWHRLAVKIGKYTRDILAYLDNYSSETVGKDLQTDTLKGFSFYFGGLPERDWASLLTLLNRLAPNSLRSSEVEANKQPSFTGCIGTFALSTSNFTTNLLRLKNDYLVAYPPSQFVLGYCLDTARCSTRYCQNGGTCQKISEKEVRCTCTGTGYEGVRCESRIRDCPPNSCHNNGICRMVNGYPECDCTNTGHTGSRCEISPCDSGGYCRNGGRCYMLGTNPMCDCKGTKFEGTHCDKSICSPGYCANGGNCYVVFNELAKCNCTKTGFWGDRCQTPLCSAQYCANNGRCLIGPDDRPYCDCRGTGFQGVFCKDEICKPNYCTNAGRCYVGPNEKPVCDCTGTKHAGDRCENPVCRSDFCQNGGICQISALGQPMCDCRSTGHTGTHCHIPICNVGFCEHGGRCVVNAITQKPECDCVGTGHKGYQCHIPICSIGYCANAGRCVVDARNEATCDCTGTGYSGPRCEVSICPPNHCKGVGTCVVKNNIPICTCYPGYRGLQCEERVCTENSCFNGGTCYPGPDGSAHCSCPFGYKGKSCEIPESCPPNYCHSGLCLVKNGTFMCDCTGTEYRGTFCHEPKQCPANYCFNKGICSVLPGNRYVCDCSSTARSGTQCEGGSDAIHIAYDTDGYLIYPIVPAVRTTEDNVTLGFKTYMNSGTLITFLTPTGKYWSIKLIDGRVSIESEGGIPYGFTHRSNDGAYHVISVKRRGSTMIIEQDDKVIHLPLIGLVNPIDESLIYNAIHIGADHKKSNIFRGLIGGVHWNGHYPIKDLREGRYKAVGQVVIVLAPDFQFPPPKPQPQCIKGYCLNGGICYTKDYARFCDCKFTGYNGARCERQSRGFRPYRANNGAFIVYHINPVQRTTNDEMRVAFQTWTDDGPIARVVQTDGSFYELYLQNNKLFATFNGKQVVPISTHSQIFNDARMHVITVNRLKDQFNFTVDGHLTNYYIPNIVAEDGSLLTQEIVLGADQAYKNTFNGVIGAFNWNGKYLFDDLGHFVSDVKVMAGPGRNIANNMDEVVVVLMPELIKPPGPIKPFVPKPVPTSIPDGAVAGGVVMSGIGNADSGGQMHIPDLKMYGGGAAGVNAGTGLVIAQAGGLFGLTGVMLNALLAGFLLALLLLLSALIWACWRCKPGCCGWCVGKSSHAGGRSTWDRIAAVCCAAPESNIIVKEKRYLLDTRENGGIDGHVGQDKIGYYHQNNYASHLDTADNINAAGMSTFRIDQPILDDLNARQNVYNLEGMKVDCVVITKNSKYVVTGSGMGPPQVWDTQSGELCKIMDGQEFGCTDLHLACDDTVLVSQVVDDITSLDAMNETAAVRVKRMQLWDFASGRQLDMPMQIMCTSSCITRSSEYVIVAQVGMEGPAILVWNLPGNQMDHVIPYHPVNQLLRDAVTYLSTSLDDRLVVAGLNNPVDGLAYFMVFDLTATYVGIHQPKYVTFSGKAEATEIISNEEAVTGTRKGELFIWNLLTGRVIRQIQISATLEGMNPTMLPPHTEMIHCIRLSADRQYLVTASQDQLARVWTMPDERLLHTLEGHADDVLSVAVSLDSEVVVTGSWDGSIRVWRMRDGNQMCWFTSNIEILQVKISNDKRALVALGERGGFRKLIMLQVLRNRTRTTTNLRTSGSRMTNSLSPPTPGYAPSSPNLMI